MSLSRRKFNKNAATLLGGGLLLNPLAGMAASAATGEPVIETVYGKVRGRKQEGGSFSFKGIPYAASTAGKNRFMPPQKRQPWAGVRDCFEWGALAPQGASRANPSTGMGEDFATFFGRDSTVPTTQSEDCLVLNVFTPGLDTGKRPVMVWIHGGGFSIGGGSGLRQDGSHLAQRQDVVVVTLNHRLGAMGYCHLGEFDPDFAHSGNAGQLDLIAALEWVRENIESFGGDPNSVLIFGESGGGGKVCTLLGMPNASGLYHRAICQSGTANRLPTASQAAEYAEKFLHELGLKKNQLAQLQQLPFEQLITTASKLEMSSRGGAGMRFGFGPTANTVDLPTHPIEAVAGGSANVPFMIGCTRHEAALFLSASGTKPGDVDEKRLQGQIGAMFGDKAAPLLAGYRTNYPDHTPGDLLVRIMSDRTRMASIDLAEAHIKGGNMPTFMYLFTWESSVLPYLKAAHGIDSTFYFDNTGVIDIAKDDPAASTLATRASTAWANFAKHDAPSAQGLPEWPEYTLEKRQTMILSAEPHVESDPMSADRKLRRELGV